MTNTPVIAEGSTGTQIIEVNGIKMEVDMRHVKVVKQYRVGDNIKVLIKNYSSYVSHQGVIVGFDQFEKLPTINIMYLESSYVSAELKLINFNEKSKDVEIAPMPEYEKIDREGIISIINRDIEKKEEELRSVVTKKKYFLSYFDRKISAIQDITGE